MQESTAVVETKRAERYIAQLCKHFGHRIPASFAGPHGELEFPFGRCTLDADTGTLTLRGRAPDSESMTRLEEVVASHLERFAWKEKPAIAWRRGAS